MRLLAAVALFFAIPFGAGPIESDVHNAYWWDKLDRADKTYFVIGCVEGMTYADKLVSSNLTLQKITLADQTTRESVTGYLEYYDISYGQFLDGVDEFYKDYRNKRILVPYVMLYVRDSIKGVPQKVLDERIGIMRAAATEPGYDKQ